MTGPLASTSTFGQAQRAFDSIAASYDDGNVLLQRMRGVVWRTIERAVPAGRVLDLGCGPGTDAVHFARRGYDVVAVDWSPRMVEETRRAAAGLPVTATQVGIHEDLPAGPFDGIYSNFGPLNCVPDLTGVAGALADRLRPGGKLVVCVMGRHVPWEVVHDWVGGGRDRGRGKVGPVPVSLGSHVVWTTYYTPRELYRIFAGAFALEGYRGLGLVLPPPHLAGRHPRWRTVAALLGPVEDLVGGWPGLRDAGDHFLMTMRRR